MGIEITEVKKIKKGRSIDRVEIRFQCEEEKKKEVEKKLVKKENKLVEMSTVRKKALSELAKTGRYHLIETLMNLVTDREIEEFMEGGSN